MSSKIKALVVCGPTATGKTSLALKIAKKFQGDLISADSRQIYKGMDIGTGKDIPHSFKPSEVDIDGTSYTSFKDYSTTMYGYDLVDPSESFSAGQYRQAMLPVLSHIAKNDRLPIIVGGTGFYIRALINAPETIGIPQDKDLRSKLGTASVETLQKILKSKKSEKFKQMNNSDRNNKRRLMRAIEVAQSAQAVTKPKSNIDALIVGIKKSKDIVKKAIKLRIEERLSMGMIEEVKSLEKKFTLSPQAASSLGYEQIIRHVRGESSLTDAKNEWLTKEVQYAKRQATWFKKMDSIHWIDASNSSVEKLVVDLVENWYA